MRMTRRAFTLTLAIAAIAVAPARAQDKPKPVNVSGRITAPGGVPVAGLDVRIDGTSMVTRTDERGGFAFIGAPGGTQELIVRGIGYLPTRRPISVPDRSTDLVITILPAPAVLDTVKVQERMHVLSGIVVDEFDHPVPGASIEVITGDKKTVTTGDDGWFILTQVREGTVVFKTRKEGFWASNTAVDLHEWRGIVVHLESLDAKMSATRQQIASGDANIELAAWRDASLRMSMKGSRAVVIGEEDLAPFGDLSLGQAIAHTKAGASIAFELQNAKYDTCVILDGRKPVGSTSLDSWRASEVEMVELYPPGTEYSNTAARYLRGAGCRNVPNAGMRSRGPFYAVLWMK